jgi:putative hydrolase of the HAD superfamily
MVSYDPWLFFLKENSGTGDAIETLTHSKNRGGVIMIKAVLWDLGGVITTSPFKAFNRFETENHIPIDFIRGINATNPETNAWALFERNRISLEEFNRKFEEETRAAGYPIPGKRVLALLSGDIRPKMARALKICKQHFTIGCITNNMRWGEEPAMPEMDEKAASLREIMGLFDVVVESSKEGIRKPDPEIYRIVLSRMFVSAEQTIFLDDLGINLKPARALGMKTIKVISETQALTDLESITGLLLS